MNGHDLAVWINGAIWGGAFGAVILVGLERVVFPLSFRLSRTLSRFRRTT